MVVTTVVIVFCGELCPPNFSFSSCSKQLGKIWKNTEEAMSINKYRHKGIIGKASYRCVIFPKHVSVQLCGHFLTDDIDVSIVTRRN